MVCSEAQHRELSRTSTDRCLQGCCFSRSSGPNSPYPGGAPSSSSRAINPSAPNAAQQGQPPNPAHRRRHQIPLEQKINRPLKRHRWTSGDRTWTRRELAGERDAFFDTRVTGRQEVWQTIHVALQALWDAAAEEGDGVNETDGFALAQGILSAGDLLLPTGDLANGVYDSFGNYYPLPEHIVCDPSNVADDSDVKAEAPAGADDTAGDDEHDETDTEANREEKDKGVVGVREQVTLCARLSENARDYNVAITTKDSIRSVARKIAEEAEVGYPCPW